jgi:hypothetical protein
MTSLVNFHITLKFGPESTVLAGKWFFTSMMQIMPFQQMDFFEDFWTFFTRIQSFSSTVLFENLTSFRFRIAFRFKHYEFFISIIWIILDDFISFIRIFSGIILQMLNFRGFYFTRFLMTSKNVKIVGFEFVTNCTRVYFGWIFFDFVFEFSILDIRVQSYILQILIEILWII